MQQKLRSFAQHLGLQLSDTALILLEQYAELVWQKKDMLNLTSVNSQEEIITRHICDGLVVTAWVAKQAANQTDFALADAGCGAGYIGLTAAIVLPHIQVTLIESLQRRCAFLQWVVMKLALTNVKIENIRLGQAKTLLFDVVTERAMGQINDVLPLLSPALKPGGLVAAYQSILGAASEPLLKQLNLQQQDPICYILPGEEKERYIAVFKK